MKEWLTDFDMETFLEMEFFSNTVEKILLSIGIFLVLFIVIHLFRKFLISRLKRLAEKTTTDLDDRIVEIFEKISSLFYAYLAFYITFKTLTLSETFENVLDGIFIFLAIYEAIKIARKIAEFGIERMLGKKDETAMGAIKIILSIILWSIGLLLILDNWGFDITALGASLGVGGIAVALAAQNVLGDLFASFSIYFDRPFKVGDFIVLGTDNGIVKRIGLKTTRIQTLQGEELIVSNKELTNTRVQNFKKMKRRRISFPIGVIYGTPLKKMKKIPEIITEIIKAQELAELDRVHFKSFGDFSLIFETVYYVDSGDYADYMNTQQAINLGIMEQFEKEKIEMAFPTQTVYVKKDPERA